MARYVEGSFGTLEKQVKSLLRTDNDAKIIIQGANSQTGIGKTTLAIKLARNIDPDWTAEEKAYIDIREYINAHLDKPEGSALVLDEIEAGADSRRFMSQDNVDLSQAWATMRARNIAVIATLPSVSMLDNRMIELADYWILVRERGLAQPYRVTVNDFNGKIRREAFPNDEHIFFTDLPDDDEDKAYLDSIKDEMLRTDESGYIPADEFETRVEREVEGQIRSWRDDLIEELAENTGATQQEIADLPMVDLHKSRVSQIVNQTG